MKTRCEIYTRVVGYIRPIQQWNLGKIDIIMYVIAGSAISLKYIHPLTKTKKDDKAYSLILKIWRVLASDSKYGDEPSLKIKIENK